MLDDKVSVLENETKAEPTWQKVFMSPTLVFVNALSAFALPLTILCACLLVLCIYNLSPSHNQIPSNNLILLTVANALLLGGLIVIAVIKTSIQNAESHLGDLNEYIHDAIDPYSADNTETSGMIFATGLSALDSLFSKTRRSVSHLLTTLAHLGDEVHDFVARYELLTNNLSAAVVIRDSDESVVFCSPYTEVLTGYSVEEIYDSRGEILSEIVLPEDRQRYSRALQISALGEDIAVRYQIKHRSGITLWVETHMVPVCDESGDVVSIMTVTLDVTASVRYQQRIEEQNRDLNDFTYMVSHDLKAPIFTIKGMATLLMEDYGEEMDDDAKESFTHIIEGANRLEQLVKSVVEYSAVSTKDFEETSVPLNKVIQEVLDDYRGQIENTSATINVPDNLPSVLGEELRMYQVFSNLIGNAIKYRSKERTPEITISVANQDEDTVSLDIRDNGSGIPEDKLADVFRPYHRAHGNEIEGSGIGLACVKKIVDRIGGSIEVQSTVEEGSCFTLTIKVADEAFSEESPLELGETTGLLT